MRLLFISLSALFISLLLLITGNAFLLTLLGVRFGQLGIDAFTIGLVMVCYSVGFVIGSLYAAKIIRRVGHIRAFAVFAALAAMAALVYPMTDTVWLWGLMRIFGGIAVACLFVTIESWFSAVATNANRSTIFSVYQIAAYLATACGQLLIGVSSPMGFAAFSLVALFLVAAIIPLSLSHMHSPELAEPKEKMSFTRMMKIAPLGVVGAFCSGFFLGAFYALTPLFASLTGLDGNQISIYMFGSILAAMLFAWPIGWVCDRSQRSNVLLVICVAGSAAAIGNAWFIEADFLMRLLLSCACMGLGASVYPISVAITNDQMDSSQIIAASTGLLLSYSFGSVVGPLVSSVFMEQYGAATLFETLAVALLCMALYTLYRQHIRAPLPVEVQEEYVTVTSLPNAQFIPEFDPRNEEFVDTPIEELFDEEAEEPAKEYE
ncbi:MFS transporter [Marinobacter sp. X15-166B]|uniref:MFS transporter n=1 Tax=Marinobacter sp. X15-166B TaxID=1897620 RepID=UPI00085CA61C|nr:MFS transporter [Marinobacter sp. X15-166B]OEY65363.1 hypothetical protein BG841_02080 [Marinobacter sp. X15-166B]